ncbi:hypothetical protein [Flavobacterium sp.]|uniref:hypothetical protein n=1 Tax=Flavobacterium sp. TaxID=239 RepID=UPI00374D27BB
MSNSPLRIKQYIDFKGITNQNFEKKIGYSNGAFATQLKNKGTIGSDKLENILIEFEDINPEWLLTGKGDMLRELANNVVNKPKEAYNLATKNENCNQKIKELEDRIDFYKEKIQFVERKLEDCEDEKKRNKTIS